jgi:hypothetical protein
MKKILTAVAAILLSVGAFAQDKVKATIIKKVKIEQPVTSLVINDGIRVVLMDDLGNELMIEGLPASVKNLAISSSKGETIISKGAGKAKSSAVYIPANFLKKIIINGPSIVSSYQPISLAMLDITVGGECDLKIQTTGKVNITAVDDYKFIYTVTSVTH